MDVTMNIHHKKDTQFMHISPIPYMEVLVGNRTHHLALAHLIEGNQDDPTVQQYIKFFRDLDPSNKCVIMDNSAFEMHQQGRPMMDHAILYNLAKKIDADYIVMPDYPGELGLKTMKAAERFIEAMRQHSGDDPYCPGLFFVPQGEPGNIDDLVNCAMWGARNHDIDYIGLSILACPYAVVGDTYGDRHDIMVSRLRVLTELEKAGFFHICEENDVYIHLLGMLDGPIEIDLYRRWLKRIDTWDSSSAIWHGLNGIEYDDTATGLKDGKLQLHVDFDHKSGTIHDMVKCVRNMEHMDRRIRGV